MRGTEGWRQVTAASVLAILMAFCLLFVPVTVVLSANGVGPDDLRGTLTGNLAGWAWLAVLVIGAPVFGLASAWLASGPKPPARHKAYSVGDASALAAAVLAAALAGGAAVAGLKADANPLASLALIGVAIVLTLTTIELLAALARKP